MRRRLRFRHKWRYPVKISKKGAGHVEYGILVSLASLIAIGAIAGVGSEVKSTFDTSVFGLKTSGASPGLNTCLTYTAGDDNETPSSPYDCFLMLSGADIFNAAGYAASIRVETDVNDAGNRDTITLTDGNDVFSGDSDVDITAGAGNDRITLAGDITDDTAPFAISAGTGNDTVTLDLDGTGPLAYIDIDMGSGSDTSTATCAPSSSTIYLRYLHDGDMETTIDNCAGIVLHENPTAQPLKSTINITENSGFTSLAQLGANTDITINAAAGSFAGVQVCDTAQDNCKGSLDVNYTNADDTVVILWPATTADWTSFNLQGQVRDSMVELYGSSDPSWIIDLDTSEFDFYLRAGDRDITQLVGPPQIKLTGTVLTARDSVLASYVSIPGGTLETYDDGVLVNSWGIDCGAGECSNRRNFTSNPLPFNEIRITDGTDTFALQFNDANPDYPVHRLALFTQ